jgi:hypothetical protein
MQFRPNVIEQPEDLRKMFEFSLDGQDVEYVRFIVWSEAWQKFYQPMLKNLEEQALAMLLDPSQERKNARSDDALRGAIYTIRAILNFPHQILAEADADAEILNQEAREAAEYEHRGRVGHFYPFGTTPGPTEYPA